jgi:hypothetical protein
LRDLSDATTLQGNVPQTGPATKAHARENVGSGARLCVDCRNCAALGRERRRNRRCERRCAETLEERAPRKPLVATVKPVCFHGTLLLLWKHTARMFVSKLRHA